MPVLGENLSLTLVIDQCPCGGGHGGLQPGPRCHLERGLGQWTLGEVQLGGNHCSELPPGPHYWSLQHLSVGGLAGWRGCALMPCSHSLSGQHHGHGARCRPCHIQLPAWASSSWLVVQGWHHGPGSCSASHARPFFNLVLARTPFDWTMLQGLRFLE